MNRKNIQYEKLLKTFKVLIFALAIIPMIVAGLVFFYVSKNFEPKPFSSKLPCISFTPDNFSRSVTYTEEGLRASLIKIKEHSNCVRIYSVTRGLEKIPEIAEKLGMEVIAGAWLTDTEPAINKEEIKNIISIGRTQKNVKYIVVGNETLLLGTLTESDLISYINRVKIGIYGTSNKNKIAELIKEQKYPPITTAEFAHIWVRFPNLVNNVDIVGLHSFPYWDGQPIDKAMDFTQNDFSALATVTAKPVVLLEAGWPTDGPRQGYAKSGLLNQRRYLDMLYDNFATIDVFYSVAEMFDVPAKISTTEGLVGPHWGIFDKNGNQKKVLYPKDIYLWFISYIFLVSIIIWYYYGFFRYPFLKNDPYYLRKNDSNLEQGIIVSFGIILVFISVISFAIMKYSKLLGANLVLLQILCGIVSLYAFFEISQKLMQFFISKHASKYLLSKYPRLDSSEIQKRKNTLVSIHIAACNEDPDQIIRTILSALSQNHKNIEVIYIDNNSKNKNSFERVKRYFEDNPVSTNFEPTKSLKLFFESSIYGFKAGALNYALKHTSDDAEYIAIMDSDYEALPNWIETGLEYTKDDIAFVQFPQAYKVKENENMIELGSRLEQDYVFKVMYPMRAMLGNIVMNGTLVIINRKAWKTKFWPMWSICEDGALGESLLRDGYRTAYVPQVAGHGRAPQSFSALCVQRSRWVFGSMQIIKMWIKDRNMKWNNTMSLYVSDWFGWIMHGLYPVILTFTVSFIFSVWLIYMFIHFDWTFYLGIISVSASLILFKFNILRYLIKWQKELSFTSNIKIIFNSILSLILLELSIVNTICFSVIKSLFTSKKKFQVTRSFADKEAEVTTLSTYKKYFNFGFILPLIFAISSLAIAIFGVHLLSQKILYPMILVLYGQIVIVFLPQLVYLIYKLKY